MKQIHTILTSIFSLVCCVFAFGQTSFTNQSSLLSDPTVFSGVAIGVVDMNGDGLDDILRLNDGAELSIEFQEPNGQPFTSLNFGAVGGEPWAIAAGDINNDGYCDIMTGGRYDDIKVLMNNGGTALVLNGLDQNDIFVQGSNLADINNDGMLDIFNCHDDGESRINAGDGLGNFTQSDNWIDMATVPSSDNSGNYGSIWTDFDNDRDLDLYIAKCRIGVGNPEDPRRINALFINDGESNYHEDADRYGLKIKHQSWTADFGDIDNDGDLDCFITNHDHTLQVLENDGAGHFTDISEAAGVINVGVSNYVQGIMRDMDNDGFLDLIIAKPSLFFHNNGDKTFTQIFPINANFGSVAAGDLNHDGFVDFYTSFQQNFNSPSGVPDKVYINDGNDNHFLNVTLQGTESNRSGIGARIEIHGPWGIQIREVRAGESYGITNSLSNNFGLGAETMVDHVVVHWPSGQVDVLGDVEADQFITIEEGLTCALSDFDLEIDGNAVICPGEMVTMEAPAGYSYLWSNGSSEQSLTVDAEGNYSVVIVDEFGCVAASNVVSVISNPDETPSIEPFGDTEFCEGGDVVLISSAADSYLWSNGETGENIIVSETGDYSVTVPGACGEYESEIVHVEVVPYPATPMADDVSIEEGQTALLEATGSNPHWYDSELATDPIFVGNSFESPALFEETTYYVEDVNNYNAGSYNTGMAAHNGSLYNGDNFNGQVIFTAHESFMLDQVTVGTDTPGEREIQLLDAAQNVLASKLVNIPSGESQVSLGFLVPPGINHSLTTNESVNLNAIGTQSPRLLRSDSGVNYPYDVPGIVTVTGSGVGSGFYYYFFDWKVELGSVDCESDRVPVTVSVLTSGVGEEARFGQLTIQPNPMNGRFVLGLNSLVSGDAELTIVDLRGHQIYSNQFKVQQGVLVAHEIDLGQVPTGLYLLKVVSGERTGWLKLVVE